jgi:hypothetical protein
MTVDYDIVWSSLGAFYDILSDNGLTKVLR